MPPSSYIAPPPHLQCDLKTGSSLCGETKQESAQLDDRECSLALTHSPGANAGFLPQPFSLVPKPLCSLLQSPCSCYSDCFVHSDEVAHPLLHSPTVCARVEYFYVYECFACMCVYALRVSVSVCVCRPQRSERGVGLLGTTHRCRPLRGY